MDMREAITKSDVLIEALPYITAYSGKVFVIKYGGSALVDPEIKKGVLEDIVFMSYVGIRPILVHGGGPFINEELKKLNRNVTFHNGLRVTTKKDMKVVNEVLTRLNLEIASDINKLGGKAVSLTTAKKTVIKAKPHKECKTLGCVGEIKKINLDLIRKSARPKTIPVISPVGIGPHKQFHNVNADDVSSEISISLKAAKLVLLTDVRGIMREKGNVETLIPTIKMEETEALITDNVIQAGMIPKVRSCTNALKGGVQKTHIVDGKIPHSLLLEIFTDTGIGTEIIKG